MGFWEQLTGKKWSTTKVGSALTGNTTSSASTKTKPKTSTPSTSTKTKTNQDRINEIYDEAESLGVNPWDYAGSELNNLVANREGAYGGASAPAPSLPTTGGFDFGDDTSSNFTIKDVAADDYGVTTQEDIPEEFRIGADPDDPYGLNALMGSSGASSAVLDGAYDTREEYIGLARAMARKYGIDENVFVNLIGRESSFNPEARPEGSSALGFGQILEGTASDPGFGVDPIALEDRSDPVKSLEFAAQYFKASLDEHNGDYRKAIYGYHDGIRNYSKINNPEPAVISYADDILSGSQGWSGMEYANIESVDPALSAKGPLDLSGASMTFDEYLDRMTRDINDMGVIDTDLLLAAMNDPNISTDDLTELTDLAYMEAGMPVPDDAQSNQDLGTSAVDGWLAMVRDDLADDGTVSINTLNALNASGLSEQTKNDVLSMAFYDAYEPVEAAPDLTTSGTTNAFSGVAADQGTIEGYIERATQDFISGGQPSEALVDAMLMDPTISDADIDEILGVAEQQSKVPVTVDAAPDLTTDTTTTSNIDSGLDIILGNVTPTEDDTSAVLDGSGSANVTLGSGPGATATTNVDDMLDVEIPDDLTMPDGSTDVLLGGDSSATATTNVDDMLDVEIPDAGVVGSTPVLDETITGGQEVEVDAGGEDVTGGAGGGTDVSIDTGPMECPDGYTKVATVEGGWACVPSRVRPQVAPYTSVAPVQTPLGAGGQYRPGG